MTKPHILLRIASILGLLFAAGHTAGAPWTTAKSVAAQGVAMMMQKVHFDVMGNERSYFDFYYGFGVSISVYLIAQAIVLWQVGEVTKTNPAAARPIMLTLFVSYLAVGVITVMYFFAPPIVFSAVICALIAWAWFKSGKGAE
jgi:hypothetical protein